MTLPRVGNAADPIATAAAASTMPVARRRIDIVFLALLVAALLLRLHLASTLPYVHDEENTSIPLAQSISFASDQLHLPIRAVNHPALPAYFVKASSTLFGTTPLAYRSVHVLASMVTILAIFLVTRQSYGPTVRSYSARPVAAVFRQ